MAAEGAAPTGGKKPMHALQAVEPRGLSAGAQELSADILPQCRLTFPSNVVAYTCRHSMIDGSIEGHTYRL
jgi:hypothetical protein